MDIKEFEKLQKQFEKDCESIPKEKYDELFEYLDLCDCINIWNEFQKECQCEDRIIYHTNIKEDKQINEDFDKLHLILNPYYRIDSYGNKDYFNDNTLSYYIEDVYEFDYEVLKYIFDSKYVRELIETNSQQI